MPAHPGRVRPLVAGGGWVRVDGRPICAVCGRGLQPTGPDRWRHAPRGSRASGRSRWLAPVTLAELRRLETYEQFGARYPWAVRRDFGGPFVTSEAEWRVGRRRLERYHAALARARRGPDLRPGANPHLDLYVLLAAPSGGDATPPPVGWALTPGLTQMLHASERRRELAALFAWALPTEAALAVLAREAPLVEVGAGSGYWSALLRSRGIDVLAYDLAPPGGPAANSFHRGLSEPWTTVLQESSVVAARRHPHRTLLLCWPPYGDDAASYAPLRAYRGGTVVFVGERPEGAAGSVRFHRELSLNWTLVEAVGLPSWPRLRDRLFVYRRNAVRRPLRERDRCFECGRFIRTGAIGRCDWCFARNPPAVALQVGDHRVEYPEAVLDAAPAPLRAALEASPSRIRCRGRAQLAADDG